MGDGDDTYDFTESRASSSPAGTGVTWSWETG